MLHFVFGGRTTFTFFFFSFLFFFSVMTAIYNMAAPSLFCCVVVLVTGNGDSMELNKRATCGSLYKACCCSGLIYCYSTLVL